MLVVLFLGIRRRKVVGWFIILFLLSIHHLQHINKRAKSCWLVHYILSSLHSPSTTKYMMEVACRAVKGVILGYNIYIILYPRGGGVLLCALHKYIYKPRCVFGVFFGVFFWCVFILNYLLSRMIFLLLLNCI